MAKVWWIAFSLLLVMSALGDARTGRLPNALACGLAFTGGGYALSSYGVDGAARALGAAIICVAALVLIELVWRRLRGTVGQGMGDLKALGALLLARPDLGLGAYAIALCLLALCGLATHHASLPLLPFLVPTFLVMAALVPLS